MKNKIIAFAALFFLTASCVFSKGSESPDYVRGLECYRKTDWTSAMFYLRKASEQSKKAPNGDEVLYMLIMSEMYAGEYKSAKADCEKFNAEYPESRYGSYISYQNGRALHFLKQNQNAVMVLSDFCHQNPDHELYASALYWIAESFYAEYNFDAARGLYERIVTDFPNDGKIADARYRIEMIEQRSREEKLLYLLKVTGEETLAAREDYERQIRLYQAEDKLGLRKQLVDAQRRVDELKSQLEAEKMYSAQLEEAAVQREAMAKSVPVEPVDVIVPEEPAKTETVRVQEPAGETVPSETVKENVTVKTVEKDPEVEALKKRARQLQFILDDTILGD